MNTNEISQIIKEEVPETRNLAKEMNTLIFFLTRIDECFKDINSKIPNKKIGIEIKIE